MDARDTLTDAAPATGDLVPSPVTPTLTVLAGAAPGRFPIGPVTRVGRAPDADVCLAHGEVSREHLRIQLLPNQGYSVEDLGSRFGSRLNGEPLEAGQPRPLALGDRLTLGRQVQLLFARESEIDEQLQVIHRLESLGRLAGGIVHDFNNLLGTVMTNLSYLQRHPPETRLDHPEVRATIQDSHAALARASDLTSQLLGFVRPRPPTDQAINYSDLVAEVVRMLRRTIPSSITLTEEIAGGLMVNADPNQLQQVLMNLVLNAVDALPAGGVIRITLKPSYRELPGEGPQPQLLLEVEDDGEGMDPETQARAFEPFFTTKPAGRGTGLGLALVWEVAEAYGGDASLESQAGRGTRARLFLPALPVAEAPQSRPSRQARGPGAPEPVLLVDDEALFRASAARFLRHLGFSVTEAGSGREALDLVKSRPGTFRVALLDLVMPTLSGEATFHALRALEPEIQVILISGQQDVAQLGRLLAGGARSFVSKPFDLETLRKELQAALDSSS